MKKFNNNFHYQLTGDFVTSQGFTVTNPVCKIITKPESAVNTGEIFNEFQGFKDKNSMNNGKDAFIFEVNGVKKPNFNIPVQDSEFYMFALGLSQEAPTVNAIQSQALFIAQLFNIDVANVVYQLDESE